VQGSTSNIGRVLGRLGEVLAKHAPDVWKTLRPGVSEGDLEVLRAAVHPHRLSADVTALFRWANGQEPGGPWWPGMECGPLLSTADAAEHYVWMTAQAVEPWQWSPLWVPIAHEGWNQAGVEIAPDSPGAVIDGSFPEPPRVIAPTLVTLFDVAADMIEAGSGFPPADGYAVAWRQKRAEFMDARPEWRLWPLDHELGTNVESWPARWRTDSRG
jgi:hypothetical protein